jgi:hypothetical protein
VRNFTLKYWRDHGWFVGRLKELPGVFSQGETLAELEEISAMHRTIIAPPEPAKSGHP